MAGWIHAEQLYVERVGEPGDGMPIGQLGGVKRPGNGVPGQSGADVRVLHDVVIVVEVEKGSATDWIVKRDASQYQQQANDQAQVLGRLKNRRRRTHRTRVIASRSRHHREDLTTER